MIFHVLEVEKTGFPRVSRPQTLFWMLGVAMVDYYDIYEKMNFVFFSNSKIFRHWRLDLCRKSIDYRHQHTTGSPIETAHGEYPVSMQKNARQ